MKLVYVFEKTATVSRNELPIVHNLHVHVRLMPSATTAGIFVSAVRLTSHFVIVIDQSYCNDYSCYKLLIFFPICYFRQSVLVFAVVRFADNVLSMTVAASKSLRVCKQTDNFKLSLRVI